MISIIDELRNIIADEFISNDDKGISILLRENQISDCQPFKLLKGNARTLTLKVDEGQIDIHPILKKGVKKLKKAPDYIVFSENRSGCFCLIIELKSKNRDDWHRQVEAGLSTAKYLVGMLENYSKKDLSAINYRCLLFHTKNLLPRIRKKKTTKQKAFKYEVHQIYNYQFTDQPCGADQPLPLFMR